MTSNAKRLIKVFVQDLSESDKNEILEYFKKYRDSGTLQKSFMEQEMITESRILGPISGNTCPYCGK